MVIRLIDKTSGKIDFEGEDIDRIPAKQFATHATRKRIQVVFQDPKRTANRVLPRFTRSLTR